MTDLQVVTPHTFSVRALPVNPVAVQSGGPQVILVPVPGGKGDKGDAGTNVQIVGETPTGVRNGINTVFTVAQAFRSGSTAVYLNGLREFLGDAYTETTSTTIQLSDPPSSSDAIRVDYLAS